MSASIDQLQSFLVLAETGNFTRAAERLGVSQSTLSHAIGRLESELGTRLFDRHTRGCRLSDAGVALQPSARRMVQEWTHMAGSAREIATLGGGRLSVAAPTAQCALMLPPVIRAFSQRLPQVQVQLHDVGEQQVHGLVRDGVADLGIATRTGIRTELVATPFYSDQYIAALPPGHALAARKSITWAQLRELPVIGPLPDNPVRRHLDERLGSEGVRLDYRHEVSLPWTMVGLVREGMGIAVLTTALQPLIEWHRLVARPIGRPNITRTLVLLRVPGRTLSTPAAVFRDLLTGAAARTHEKA
jgi:LysR family carnitine catabolism transcriptional activator